MYTYLISFKILQKLFKLCIVIKSTNSIGKMVPSENVDYIYRNLSKKLRILLSNDNNPIILVPTDENFLKVLVSYCKRIDNYN